MPRLLFCRLLSMVLCFFSLAAAGQKDSVQNLYFVHKDRPVVFEKEDYKPGKNSFYLYRNCYYDLVLLDGRFIAAKLIDIRNDSIYVRVLNHLVADSFALAPSQLKKIRLITDRLQ